MSFNKVAIVTGANKGLGFALVKELCDKLDGIVYLTSRDEKRGIEATEKIKQLGYYPKYHQLDAGILFLKDAKESKYVQAEQTILINFTALVNFTEAMLPFIADGGKIVNISSSSGHLSRIPSGQLREKISSPNLTLKELQSLMNDYLEAVKVNKDIEDGWGDSPYVVSKVGVNAYTFLLNRRLANRGIKVDCVHPGYVISDMTRGSGNVSPEEAAKVVIKVALDSENGGRYFWHNGDVVPWDGSDPRVYIDGRK
ncbi:Carbonyl reductase [NADPH] 1 [Papilio machaon]|uniref:Carbonyl reductase [NADPH] 1 n=1 Tax=Papilio machaon TaxID=76193 RepID=A0A0N1PKA0_PAPMA|nr:Carbonyl reductase [NADPH] 1 [Papilio machaon]